MLSRITLLALLASLCPGQDSARKEITLDAQTLNRYVGAYQIANGPTMLITLENGQLFSKLGNQQPIAIFPESKTMFFPKVLNAEFEFAKDDDRGRPTELILHQNGRDLSMTRLDDAQAKQAADAAAALAKRIKEQKPAPGGEAALRKMIEGLRLGKPDYSTMSAGLADATRQQLTGIQAEIAKLGALQSVTFQGVGPGGADFTSSDLRRARWSIGFSLERKEKLRARTSVRPR